MKLGQQYIRPQDLDARLERVGAKLLGSKGARSKYSHSNGTRHVVVTHEGNRVLLEEYDQRCDCGF